MSFDHVMETACAQTITLLYIYLYVWGLDLRLNNINFHQSLSFIIYIDLNHHCHHYWTSESLLNLWEYTQDSDITNKWVVHFVIFPSNYSGSRTILLGNTACLFCTIAGAGAVDILSVYSVVSSEMYSSVILNDSSCSNNTSILFL